MFLSTALTDCNFVSNLLRIFLSRDIPTQYPFNYAIGPFSAFLILLGYLTFFRILYSERAYSNTINERTKSELSGRQPKATFLKTLSISYQIVSKRFHMSHS
jgi:hypothetical protein